MFGTGVGAGRGGVAGRGATGGGFTTGDRVYVYGRSELDIESDGDAINNNGGNDVIPGTGVGNAFDDITVTDLAVTVDVARMRSKSKNTPFDGWQLRGGVAATIVGGRVVYVNDATALRTDGTRS